jgi:EAL domain-containing protein (putative c-di-GMP-specific phosphodiesterase class I)
MAVERIASLRTIWTRAPNLVGRWNWTCVPLSRAASSKLYYQPIQTIGTGEIIAFEALARWNHPIRGMIQPPDFIPLAEQTRLIVPIGDWVLRTACSEAAGWSRKIRIAVNLSAVQFKNRKLVESVQAALS